MFTGIIEAQGKIRTRTSTGTNLSFIIESSIASSLKVDESLSHNGICLTVEEILPQAYKVTAVQETINKTNIIHWQPGNYVNLERAMVLNGRLDGHMVQGHVDDTSRCIDKKDLNGSWEFSFQFNPKFAGLMIEKGSICLNGVSLTAYNLVKDQFMVSIIPYTFNHTNFYSLNIGDLVNVEYDILGKYVSRMLSLKQ